MSMIPKSGYRFSEKIMLSEKPAVVWQLGKELPSKAGRKGPSALTEKEDSKAMAGSPDAALLRAPRSRGSVSPSCSWLSLFRITDERKPKCSISILLSSIGVDAS
jgi:hypothetical protein